VSKRKPDQVINFRVELQEHERKILDNYLTASSINGFMEALDKLTSFENLYIIATVLELITGKEILPGTPNDSYAIIDAVRDAVKKDSGWAAEVLDDRGPLQFLFEEGTILGQIFKRVT